MIRERKAEHSAESLLTMSEKIEQEVLNRSCVRNASVILCYHALADEVNTDLLLSSLLKQGKTVLLPRVVSDTEMELRLYEGKDDVETGAYGIMEPVGELFSDYASIDVAIIPGMAFDPEGNRLGRGKGYYDRLLPSLVNAYKIGVCFSFQKVESVCASPHDVRMDEVVVVNE